MKSKIDKKTPINASDTGKENPPGYPLYPADEDIFNRARKEDDSDLPGYEEEPEMNTTQDADTEGYGSDLDIPGAELDDDREDIGNEDEENNYYSLGGDNHNDLEEDQGDQD